MESEHHYELRSSRSRSLTPMVPNQLLLDSEVTEHHYDLRNRSRERSHTPGEITSRSRRSRRSSSRLAGSSNKINEKNMEVIEENMEGSIAETDNQSTKSESSSVITRKIERRSERQRTKKQIFANGQSESKDISDSQVKQKHKSTTPCRILTSDYSSEEGEKEDPPSRPESAFQIYKQAGEWWNVFPKTDYTYSPTSQYRYEIAPGILAMPNMSRRSIHLDGNNTTPQVSSSQNLSQTSRKMTESGFSDSVEMDSLIYSNKDDCNILREYRDSTAESTIYRKTHVEQYMSHKEVVYSDFGNFSTFRQRYPLWSNISSNYPSNDISQFHSDDELDEAFVSSVKTDQRWRIVQWFTYLIAFITVPFRKTINFFKFGSNRKRQYYDTKTHSYHEYKWSAFWKSLNRYLYSIYLFYIRILVFDAWLLSQFTGIRKWLQEKSPKILWITLLPLLLLLGAYIAQEHYFTCVDSLRNVQYGVTETTYHIFNDITNLTSFDYASFAKYIANFKDYFIYLLPSVNVSLPEIPPIGWNITW